jgi:hypothetical protein
MRSTAGVLAAVAIVVVALPGTAPASTRKAQNAASTALKTLASTVRHSGVKRREAKSVAKDLRRAARSLSGRKACAGLAAVAEAHSAATKAKAARRRSLLRHVNAADRALRRLPATRHCGPRVRHIRIRRAKPRYNPAVAPGPLLHEQGGEEDYDVPRDRHSKPQGPSGAPTDVGSSGAAALTSTVTDPLQLLTTTDLGPLGRGTYPQEPQVAKKGELVLFSGNTNGAVSFDGGAHFTRVDPNRVFGNDPGPICCDTVVRYAPTIDRFLWLMQYWCPPPKTGCDGENKKNRYRLAVISPRGLQENRADPTRGWQVYDLTAQRYGSGTWFDYPDMAVGSRNLYLTWDLVGVGTANSRIPLRELTGGGTLDVEWFQGRDIFYRLAQNPTETAFFLKNSTDSFDAGYAWHDFLSSPIDISLPHATRPGFFYNAIGPNGLQNWNDRAGSPIVKGATLAGDQLWVAWAAGRWFDEHGIGPTWPQPHIQYAVYDTPGLFDLVFRFLFDRSLHLRRDGFIWSPTTSYTNPVLATNAEGDVGITFVGGDPHTMATPYVGVLTNRSETLRAVLSLGPTVAVVGDYAGLQPDSGDPTKWVAANVFTTNDPVYGLGDNWLYTRFGRSATPPPAPKRTPASVAITSTTGTTYACCFVTDQVNVFGHLSGPPPGEQVKLEYKPPSGTGTITQTVTTDGSGVFTGHFTPAENQAGPWTIVARYAGSITYESANSDPYYLYVSSIPI